MYIFLYFVTLLINIESVFLFVGYMKLWTPFDGTDSAMYAVIYDCAFSIYGSKVGAHYRSTLFTDLNLEITQY